MSKQIMQSLRSDRLKSLNISPQVHYVIEELMAKDPEIRFQHPQAIVEDIDTYLESVGYSPIPTAPAVKEEEPAKKKTRRREERTTGTKKPISRRRRYR